MDKVFVSKSGKSYSYKRTVLYNTEISLDEARERGYVQNKSKWAQKEV